MDFWDYVDGCLTVCLKLVCAVIGLGFMFIVLALAIMIWREALAGTLISELQGWIV